VQKGGFLFFHIKDKKDKLIKNAFTMLELVFVIVVVGILVAQMAPRFTRDNLQEAADQVISSLRYTKHLAMIDDKFNTTDPIWFKSRWQLKFSKNSGSDNKWSYTVFSDWKGYHTGNPDRDEIAKNPLDDIRYLTGGTSGTDLIKYTDSNATKELNIGNEYGIVNVKFSGGCRSNVKYISFDYLGRPFNSFPNNLPYELPSSGYHKLITSTCKITLCTDVGCGDNITIAIEPQTGYIHIL